MLRIRLLEGDRLGLQALPVNGPREGVRVTALEEVDQRAPLFFVATGSMANVGGAASAPVVAGVYHPAMAPVGLLMAVFGYVLGIYAALACAWLLALVAA